MEMTHADFMNMQYEYKNQFGHYMNLDGDRLSIQFFRGWTMSSAICPTR